MSFIEKKNMAEVKTLKKFDDFKLAEEYFSKEKYLPGIKDGVDWMIRMEKDMRQHYHQLWFYLQYSRQFPSAMLLEEAEDITSKKTEAWVKFCITHMDEYLEEKNSDFDSDLERFSRYSPLTFEKLESIFHKYKPFLLNINYFQFAYDNIESPLGRHFYILLMIWLESTEYPEDPRFKESYQKCINKDQCEEFVNCRKEMLCTLDKARYGEDYSFEEEMREYQKKLIDDFLRLAPKKDGFKDKAVPFLLKAFEDINKTGEHRDKLYTTMDKIFNPKDAPLTGKLFITWDKVEFFNGFYLIQHPKTKSSERTKCYRIDDACSRKVFNDINSYFLKKLPPLYVEFVNGYVKNILNKSELASCITTMEHRVAAQAHERKKSIAKPEVKRKELTKAEAQVKCKELKSRFLNYLADSQLDDYKVICSIENRVNASSNTVQQEYSFIFTIRATEKRLFLAYENVTNSRCTYIFPVNVGEWQRSVDALYNFFASGEVNKRQALSQRLVDLRLPGNFEYKRIMHDNYLTWVDKIKYCHIT